MYGGARILLNAAASAMVQHRLRLIYILTNAFCLWSIIEFFVLTLWFHTVSVSAEHSLETQIVSRALWREKLFSRACPPSDSTLLRHAAPAEDGLQNWCACAFDRLWG